MRHFQPYSAIVAALKESTVLDVVQVGDEICVQRKVPVPENFKDMPQHEIQEVFESEAMARSVYAKGFGEELPSTQFDIEAFFAKYGPTNCVRLRRTHEKLFKGSVFVEFDSEETQKAFLALDPKPTWKGTELQIKSKKQYCDDKVEDIKSGRVPPNTHWKSRHEKPKWPTLHNQDKRDWRDRRDEDQKGGFKDRGRGRRQGFGASGRGGRGGRGGGKGRRDGQAYTDRKPTVKDEQ